MAFESTAGLKVRNHYGERKVAELPGEVSTSDLTKEISVLVDLSEVSYTVQSGAATIVLFNPASASATTGLQSMEAVIPAYATIKSARAVCESAVTTTGMSAAANIDLLVGLDKYSDGTAIDADGLIDATDGAVTISSFNVAHAAGDQFVGSNAALVPNVDIGADDAQIYAAISIDDDTGLTALAGKLRIVVEYVDSRSDGSSRYTAGGTKA